MKIRINRGKITINNTREYKVTELKYIYGHLKSIFDSEKTTIQVYGYPEEFPNNDIYFYLKMLNQKNGRESIVWIDHYFESDLEYWNNVKFYFDNHNRYKLFLKPGTYRVVSQLFENEIVPKYHYPFLFPPIPVDRLVSKEELEEEIKTKKFEKLIEMEVDGNILKFYPPSENYYTEIDIWQLKLIAIATQSIFSSTKASLHPLSKTVEMSNNKFAIKIEISSNSKREIVAWNLIKLIYFKNSRLSYLLYSKKNPKI